MNTNSDIRRGHAAIVVAVAIATVAILGFVPWESITGGLVRDFDLFADLKPLPEPVAVAADSVVADPAPTDSVAADSVAAGAQADTTAAIINVPQGPRQVDGVTLIEDYSPDRSGLENIATALAAGRHVRIAVVGDSYIEGDIMSQDLRATLQKAYGGGGVGFMNMHSEFPGFRQSVRQSSKGWKCYTASQRGQQRYMGLSEQYAIAQSGKAQSTYEGVSRVAHADCWDCSMLLFVAPEAATVRVRCGKSDWVEHSVLPSDSVQAIAVDSVTERFSVEVSSPSLAALGVWLDRVGRGVSVDCMSSRGVPGYSLEKIPVELCHQMARWVDYDLIILEYGINVLSAKQSDYSTYGRNMARVIGHLRDCYPSARIMVMGIGDRGERRDGAVHTMSTVPAMIAVQRQTARTAGTLFWDTQAAMGGTDAIVDWSATGKANKDYVHLSHKGGRELGEALARSIIRMVGQ